MYTNMKKNKVTRKFKLGGVHGKHAVATWKLGTISEFAYTRKHRETKKNLCRVGRSQDLPDTDF